MTLRRRLLIASLLVALPVAAALFYAGKYQREAQMTASLRDYLDRENVGDARLRCEQNPAAFSQKRGPAEDPLGRGPGGDGGMRGRRGGPPPAGPGAAPIADRSPFEFFVYDVSFAAETPGAPPLSEAALASLRAHASSTSTFASGEGDGVQIVTWTSWAEGPCAIFVGRIRPRPGEVREQAIALAAVIGIVFLAVWFAAGPVVSRLQRLADDVHASADSHYEHPVRTDGGGEIAVLAAAFNDAGARVREHLRDVHAREETLRTFVANTTHDVAVPLTVLQGYLADLDRTDNESPTRETIRAAIQEAHYLSSLVRNLSAATRLDAAGAPLELSPVDLNALVERVAMRHTPVARVLGVDVNHAVPETPLIFRTDLTLLEQAVGNLVDNAVHYNRAGGHVAIVLDGHTPHSFVVTVTDDGPGVPEPDLARLATRTFRGDDARTRRPDGHGIGLAIVADVCERLGCTLSFRRPPEGGLAAEIRSR